MVIIDSQRCTGCGACVEACPEGAIWLVQDEFKTYAEIDQARCTACEACIEVCPEGAIQVQAEPVRAREGIVVEPEIVPVKARPQAVQPARPAAKALAWLGPVLAFLGREIVPRVTALLLDAWDRRAAGAASTPRASSGLVADPPAQEPTPGRPGPGGGRRHRWRSGRGGG